MMIRYEQYFYLKAREILLFTLFFLLGGQAIYGQLDSGKHPVNITIPEIMILDFEPNNLPIEFKFEPSIEAGGALQINSTQQTKWLNYTCGLNSTSSPRNIYMQVANGDLPEGISLNLKIGNPVGGGGQLGASTGSIQLREQAQLIITGIGGSYTGNGPNLGYPITYEVEVSDYSKLQAASFTNIQIMVTITD